MPTTMEIIIAVVFFVSFIPGGIIKRKYHEKGKELPTGKPAIESKKQRIAVYALNIAFSTIYGFIAPLFLLLDIYHLTLGWSSLTFLISNTTIVLILQIVGISLYVIGFTLYSAGRLEIKEWFAELWSPSKLGDGFTSSGVYSCMRHPLYTGAIIFSVGMILVFQTWFGLLLYVYPIIMIIWTAYKEEALLLERFGDEYRQYMNKTGRFLPRL
ncbi:MAG: methyltransferase family protein [Candidatus Helarchaeota archaeon]